MTDHIEDRIGQQLGQYRLLHLPDQGGEAQREAAKPERLWKLPATLTPLVGREQEVISCCELLRRPTVRLLALTGTGGVGKTRLSLEVAQQVRDDFDDGICFVSLAPICDPDLVLPSIAQEYGIQETGAQSLLEQVKLALQHKHLLLLLDNFEQVLAAAPLIEQLLVACPQLKVLVTSREVLHLQGEFVFAVVPLRLPDLARLPGSETLEQSAAIQLFVQRAQALLPSFQLTSTNAHAIAEICVRLDGLPLALELAAARINLLPPQALLARLTHRLQVLTRGARTSPARQQTLRSTLKWSYDLLTPREQRLFRLLAVFAGGSTLGDVEALWSATYSVEDEETPLLEDIASLIDKSLLLQVEQGGEEPHLQLLETVREYGLDCLQQPGEAEAVRRAHAMHYLALTEEAALQLKGRQQTRWLVRLEQAQENWRAALNWFIEHGEAEGALRCCGALWWFWHLRGYWSEGRRWLAAALVMVGAGEPTATRALALCAAGDLAYYQDDYPAARLFLEEGVALCRELGSAEDLARALSALGVLLHVQGDPAAANPVLQESEQLCRKLDNTWELAYLLRKLGYLAWRDGDVELASAYAQEGLVLARKLGDQALIATTLCTLGEIAADHSALSQALDYYQEGLSLARKLGDQALIALATQNLGYLALLQRNLAEATAYAQDGLTLARELGDKWSIILALHSLGSIALKRDDWKQAKAHFEESLRLAREVGNETWVGWNLIGLAEVAAGEGQPTRTAHLLGAAETRLDVNVRMNDIERADYKQAVEGVQVQLGKETFAAAWAEGRGMTVEQVLSTQEPVRESPQKSAESLLPESARGRMSHRAGLTAREIEVLQLVAQGLTDAQVAEQLVISPRTVNFHLTSIYGKIGVTSRTAATRYAIEHHLIG